MIIQFIICEMRHNCKGFLFPEGALSLDGDSKRKYNDHNTQKEGLIWIQNRPVPCFYIVAVCFL